MLLAIDFDEHFINEESVALPLVLSLQSACINGTEFYAPETDRFSGYCDASLAQQIFDIAEAQIETIVEPDCVTDDIGRE